ncbi:xanthine dehydrogenase accessory protein XdhC [Glutamicibacter uratoxydans]|uniref:xanthine dehydrogenase accessory protein XdhC n=1 Tax=Glutamicibacter uratoxydans TaxID=43667 RepID=UPI003D6F53E6
MRWAEAVIWHREHRLPAVLTTVLEVRGHAPRGAGTKMLVGREALFGTIGGGNLEMTVVSRARDMLEDGATELRSLQLRLNERAVAEFGRQCCGGEVKILLEPLPVPPVVAIFGVGHVGMELVRILSRHDLDLYLSDSRVEHLNAAEGLEPAVAQIHTRHAVIGEAVLSRLPPGTHVLIMTHDHAEDFHLCDAALRHPCLGSIGVIGSKAKWQRFRKNLSAAGHEPQQIDRIHCPIGDPSVVGNEPAMIALSVAVDLLKKITRESVSGTENLAAESSILGS